MILKPREYFPITRQLYDPFDANTYYVKAVIRNENTNEIIDTVNLTDEGNQLFRLRWQVPPDVSGEGFWISVRTRVYTDSAYTTLSPNHEQNLESHLVSDRMRFSAPSGGGGSDVDYKKIATLLKEALDKHEFPEMDADPILAAIGILGKKVVDKIDALPKPETPEKVDLSPVLLASKETREMISNAEKRIGEKIEGIEIPEQKEIDFTPILTVLSALDKRFSNAEGLERYIEVVKELSKTAPGIAGKIEEVVPLIKNIEQASKDFLYLLQLNAPRKETKPERKSFMDLFEVKDKNRA